MTASTKMNGGILKASNFHTKCAQLALTDRGARRSFSSYLHRRVDAYRQADNDLAEGSAVPGPMWTLDLRLNAVRRRDICAPAVILPAERLRDPPADTSDIKSNRLSASKAKSKRALVVDAIGLFA